MGVAVTFPELSEWTLQYIVVSSLSFVFLGV